MSETRGGEPKQLSDVLIAFAGSGTIEVKQYPFVLSDDEARLAELRAHEAKNYRRRWIAASQGFTVDEYQDEPLNEEEKEKAVSDANRHKYQKIEFDRLMVEKARREKEQEDELIRQWDAAAFLKLMRYRSNGRGVKLVENEFTLPVIKAICFRLSLDPRYETELGYSFGKGLMVRGNPGLGKSYLFQLVADNPIRKIQIITMNEIVNAVRQSGDFTGIKFNQFDIIYIDDVGTEYFGDNAIKRYGTDVNWFKNFIEEFYSKHKQFFNRIIFSTNDSFNTQNGIPGLEAKYGFRVRDRLAECFDVLDVYGESMRRN